MAREGSVGTLDAAQTLERLAAAIPANRNGAGDGTDVNGERETLVTVASERPGSPLRGFLGLRSLSTRLDAIGARTLAPRSAVAYAAWGALVYASAVRSISLPVAAVTGAIAAYYRGPEALSTRKSLDEPGTMWPEEGRMDLASTDAVGILLDEIRCEFGADALMLVERHDRTSAEVLRVSEDLLASDSPSVEPISIEFAELLLCHDTPSAVSYTSPGLIGHWLRAVRRPAVAADSAPSRPGRDDLDALAALVDAESFVCGPLDRGDERSARMYLVWKRRRRIDGKLLRDFGRRVAVVSPILSVVRRFRRLAESAEERIRASLGRDLHDSAIQPLIGLHLGLAAVCERVAAGDLDIAADLNRLRHLAEQEVGDLRGIAATLRTERDDDAARLRAEIGRLVERFEAATAIRVDLVFGGVSALAPKLENEVLNIVAEGLSNVRRHTQAGRVRLHMECEKEDFVLRIVNDASSAPSPFAPRSISERTAALGGRVSVSRAHEGVTELSVSIPIR